MTTATLTAVVPYEKGAVVDSLNNTWVINGFIDNMETENGYGDIEFTKVGLIDFINRDEEEYASETNQEPMILPYDISDAELKRDIETGMVVCSIDGASIKAIKP